MKFIHTADIHLGAAFLEKNQLFESFERIIEDVKNEGGKRKYLKTYVLTDAKTGEPLVSTNETKAKAKELAKELYTKHNFRGDVVCTLTKSVVEGEPVAFRSYYTPSKASHVGTYLVFGVEA